jgi:hypothetical protein
MKQRNYLKTIVISMLLLLVSVIIISPFAFKSRAAALAAAYVYLSRIKADLDGGSAAETVEMVIALDTSQSIGSGGTVTIQFPDADDTNWCRTADALTVTAVTASAADQSSTIWAIDAGLPTSSSLAGTCTQGSGASSYDTIVISNVGALTAGTTYGVKIANGDGIIGTDDTAGVHTIALEAKNGTAVDVSSFGLELIADDIVVVSATVSATPSVTCVIDDNTVDIGTLYPGGAYLEASNHITATTSSTADGYYWATYGTGDGSTYAGLYYSGGPYLIPSNGTLGRVDLTAIESEGFGITASQPTGATVNSDFATGTAGVYGELGLGVAGAKMLLFQGSAETGGDQSTITYGARASSAATAGSYTESVYFVCGGYY